ncbi:MAG: MgtC/SapB family protein [Phycisphaerae bacterium]|nr:MgtC/SapB family protein [Phycisphaerales bacterium]
MPEELLSIAPLKWIAIACAMLCGAIIGLERQMLGKPVGIRTSVLVCLSTYIFVTISNSVAAQSTDPSRVIGQIITGVGFLGAGVMMSRDGLVVGVTSAAAIWILAAIGVTIASGFHVTAVKLAILAVAILVGVNKIEGTFGAMQRGVHRRLVGRKRRRQNGGHA